MLHHDPAEDKMKAILPSHGQAGDQDPQGREEVMHELGIVFHVIRAVENIGREQGLTDVASVTPGAGPGVRRGAPGAGELLEMGGRPGRS